VYLGEEVMKQSNSVSHSEKDLRKISSVLVVVAMIGAGLVTVFAFAPANVVAVIQLDVTGTDYAPIPGAFAGDNNITMLWLELVPQDEAVSITSLTFDKTITSSAADADITKIFLFSDLDGNGAVDWAELQFQTNMGILASVNNPTFPQTMFVPGYTVPAFTTRGIFVYIDVAAGSEGETVGIELTTMVCADPAPNIQSPASSDITLKYVIWSDDMESGVGGWTVVQDNPNVFWHQTNYWYYNYMSPVTSWWYGSEVTRNYQTPGSRNTGNLTSAAVDLAGYSDPGLSFWHDLQTENWPNSDEGRLFIEDTSNPGVWVEENLWFMSLPNWTKESVDLNVYAGKSIRLRFSFDTVDAINNIYMGWLIDNVFFFGSQETNDVATQDFSAPKFALPTDTVDVTATIYNLGQGAEDNATNGIDAWLRIDGSYIPPETNIPSLPLGGSQGVSFQWTPGATGDYEVCIHAWPVSGETATANNLVCTTIQVRDVAAKKVVVVRSYGTKVGIAIATWQDINTNWESYGPTPLDIDWDSLNKSSITYADIVASGADVLLVSSSAGLGLVQPWSELTNSEINDIKQYVFEGHGLVATYSTFFNLIPMNNNLTDMFGIIDQPYDRTVDQASTSINKENAAHPLFTNVPGDPFTIGTSPNIPTTWPQNDGTWDGPDLRPGSLAGEYIAMSASNNTTLVVYRNMVYFSWMPEFLGNLNDKQLLYNALAWSQYVPAAHDVQMSAIEGPVRTKPVPSVDITATITNLAPLIEDNGTLGIDVLLKQDGLVVNQVNIPTLNIAESQQVILAWGPPGAPVPMTYNICMEAVPVAGETDTTNNEVCMDIEVVDPNVIIVAVLDSWGTDNPGMAPWDDLVQFWDTYGSFELIIDYTTLDIEGITLQDIEHTSADVLLISSSNSTGLPTSEFTAGEITAIQTYVEAMDHGIIGTGTVFNSQTLPANSQLASLMGVSPGGLFTETTGVDTIQMLNSSHSIFANVSSDPFTTASGTSCTPGLGVPDPGGWTSGLILPGAEYIGNSTPEPSAGAIVVNDTGNYRGVFLSSMMEAFSNVDDKQIIYNSIVWASGRTLFPVRPPNPPQDLWITKMGLDLELDWIDTNPAADVVYNIFRATTVDGFNFGGLPYASTPAPPYTDIDVADDANNYYYVVRAYNTTSTLTENNTDKVGKFYNLLHKGTNDISIPFELQFTDVALVFAEIDLQIDEVAVFDSGTGTWETWPTGTLTDVDNTMGIRVTSNRNNLPFISVGRVPKNTTITLSTLGSPWFFVGYPNFKVNPLPDILDDNGLLGLYLIVYHYDPTDRKSPWKWYDPNDPLGSPLTDFETGKGYWIRLIASGTWVVPGE
jgi:hypothetical protein